MTSRLFSGRAAVLIGALALLAPHASAGNRPVARPTLVDGGGEQLGGTFRAGPNGARYAIPGGIDLALRPGTQARVVAVPQQLPLRPGRRTPTYSVMLRAGRVDVDVRPKGFRAAVLIATPAELKAIVVKGQVAVLATDREASAANLGADMLASVDERWLSLEPGTIWTVGRGDLPGKKTKLIAPPAPLSATSALLGLTGKAKLGDCRWSAVPGASQYRVTLYRQGEEDPVGSLTTQSTQLSGAFGPLAPGRYELRVASVDALGLVGPPSAPFPIRVLGAQLPVGATVVDNTTIELGQGQTVSFTETDGMIMRYAGMDGAVAADSPVGLQGARARVLSLSFPGAITGTLVRLRPRRLAASIQIGPRHLTWPGPPATISVELTNGGEPIPPWLVPVFAATINLKPVDSGFTREGNTLQAIVANPGGDGPWVVRVEVRDQTGALLGRDFLEVEERRATSYFPRPSSMARSH
ncbi:MAG: hypothetical protein JW940_17730 [Polyangiaceae bacterium]|nr:hypothetical protein [Polyangiaceae bacterium]